MCSVDLLVMFGRCVFCRMVLVAWCQTGESRGMCFVDCGSVSEATKIREASQDLVRLFSFDRPIGVRRLIVVSM